MFCCDNLVWLGMSAHGTLTPEFICQILSSGGTPLRSTENTSPEKASFKKALMQKFKNVRPEPAAAAAASSPAGAHPILKR
jgi:hypothetical protein